MPAYNTAVAAHPMPDRIKALRVSDTGFPVPWFVADIDGKPDFRVVDPAKMVKAHRQKLCWTCGQPRGRVFAMLLGPMCIVNRTIGEPPSHRECAIYAATVCPFLANPRMRRREANLPEGGEYSPGAITRNPGAVAVWTTRSYSAFRQDGANLFSFDDPEEVYWFCEGRAATRAEVVASIDSGIPLLEAEAQKQGPAAVAELQRMRLEAERYLPAA